MILSALIKYIIHSNFPFDNLVNKKEQCFFNWNNPNRLLVNEDIVSTVGYVLIGMRMN